MTTVKENTSTGKGVADAGSRHLKDHQPAITLRLRDFQDDFEIAHPDEIMNKIHGKSMSKTIVLSVIFHIVALLLFSVGYLRDAGHYHTLYPSVAKAEEAKQKRIEEKKAKAAEAETKKQAAKAATSDTGKTAPATATAAPTGDGARPLSKIEKELQETSDKRPAASSLNSIDDNL